MCSVTSSNLVQWKLRGMGNLHAKKGETLYAASVNWDLTANWHKLLGCSANSHDVLLSMHKSWRGGAALRFWIVNFLQDRVHMTLKKNTVKQWTLVRKHLLWWFWKEAPVFVMIFHNEVPVISYTCSDIVSLHFKLLNWCIPVQYAANNRNISQKACCKKYSSLQRKLLMRNDKQNDRENEQQEFH